MSCKSSFLAFSLALCFALPLQADGGFLLDQKARNDIFVTLNELESNLQALRISLQSANENVTRLDERLTSALNNLAKSEKSLTEARQKLADSEASLAEVQATLTQVSQALTASEESFKAYQRSELARGLGWATGGAVVGGLAVFLLHLFHAF